jgi:hypothetical protein
MVGFDVHFVLVMCFALFLYRHCIDIGGWWFINFRAVVCCIFGFDLLVGCYEDFGMVAVEACELLNRPPCFCVFGHMQETLIVPVQYKKSSGHMEAVRMMNSQSF